MIHLDTHVVVWLYAGDTRQFPPRVAARIEAESLAVSPIVALEIDFLREIGRVNVAGAVMVDDLARSIGLSVLDTALGAVTAAATPLTWTRDPFDRLIVANALAEGAALLTRDKTIRRHCRTAIWS